jgi:hypothetical protein
MVAILYHYPLSLPAVDQRTADREGIPQPKPELHDAPASLFPADEPSPRREAMRDMRRFTFVLPHFGQVTSCFCDGRTIFSNSLPHFGQSYSNNAMVIFS